MELIENILLISNYTYEYSFIYIDNLSKYNEKSEK